MPSPLTRRQALAAIGSLSAGLVSGCAESMPVGSSEPMTTETFHEPVYRPAVEPVASLEAHLQRILDAQLVDARLDPKALSKNERQIVRQARGDGYEATHPFPEALNALLRKLDKRAYIDGNISKDAFSEESDRQILKYGDEYFEYRLRLESQSEN